VHQELHLLLLSTALPDDTFPVLATTSVGVLICVDQRNARCADFHERLRERTAHHFIDNTRRCVRAHIRRVSPVAQRFRWYC
jgi:hypothetical protein